MDTPESTQWRVPRRVPVAKLLAGAVVVAVGLVAGAEVWQLALAGAVAAGMAAWSARDLVAPVRLAADPQGLTVLTGFAHQHRLAWSEIDRVRVDRRRRSRLLEVDTGDELYLFSRYEMDADLDDVAAELEARRLSSA